MAAGPLEVGDVGAGRQRDAELVRIAGVLVVLRDSFADLGRSYPDDGVGCGVVVWVAAEDLYAKGALLKLLAAPLELFFNDESEEAWKPLAVRKMGVGEQTFQLLLDVGPLLLAVKDCPNCRVCCHNVVCLPGIIDPRKNLCRL